MNDKIREFFRSHLPVLREAFREKNYLRKFWYENRDLGIDYIFFDDSRERLLWCFCGECIETLNAGFTTTRLSGEPDMRTDADMKDDPEQHEDQQSNQINPVQQSAAPDQHAVQQSNQINPEQQSVPPDQHAIQQSNQFNPAE